MFPPIRYRCAWLPMAARVASGLLAVAGCSGGSADDGPAGLGDASTGDAGGDSAVLPDGGAFPDAPAVPPKALVPCQNGLCWSAPKLASACGTATINEDFSTGLYNVHQFALSAPAKVPLDLSAQATAGNWEPVLIVQDEQGATIHDGELPLSTAALSVQAVSSGRGSDTASVRVTADSDRQLALFVTSWDAVDGDFKPLLPADATYTLTNFADCVPSTGGLLSPPNFDPNDQDGGFFLLPPSSPAGLYLRKADDCSRGTKLLIDVLYTVAVRWQQLRPTLAPINIRDLNEGSCSTVDHATHDDGTHADLTVSCATQVACTDNQPKIDLAKLFVDTGAVCGILNNDEDVQPIVNEYFASKFSYQPWKGKFMRTVSGHTGHFHVRVMKPDGSCN